MTQRILLLNPIGVSYMDDSTLDAAERNVYPGTQLEVRNLGRLAPQFPWPDPASEDLVVEAVRSAEAEGFDGVVIACCADPFLSAARQAVSIPITAPTEAAVATSRMYGRLGVMTRWLPTEYDSIFPGQVSWDSWETRIQGYGLQRGGYELEGIRVPDHPLMDDFERLSSAQPDVLKEKSVQAQAAALLTRGVEVARTMVREAGVDLLYPACAYWSGTIDELENASELFGAPVLNPVGNATKFLEQALLSAKR